MKCGSAVQVSTMELSNHTVLYCSMLNIVRLNGFQYATGDYIQSTLKWPIKAGLKDSMRATYNSSWNKKPQRCHRFRNGLLKLNPVYYNCIDTNNHQQCFQQGVYTSEGQTEGKLVTI